MAHCARREPARLFFALLLFSLVFAAHADSPLVETGSVWRYLDDGSDQRVAWRATTFDDAAWKSGPAQLGYGDGDEATVVGYGPDPDRKHVTTYFRHAFSIADRSSIAGLTLRLIRDDGAVVFVNGIEVWRVNMPAGPVAFDTLANVTAAGEDESTWLETHVDPSVLIDGKNVVAVEVHQADRRSSDLSFALSIAAKSPDSTPALLRGPYLQQGTPASVVIRWRTDIPSRSRVRFGTSADDLASVVDGTAPVMEHEIALDGLTPFTRYFYSVGTPNRVLSGDASHTFVTAPPAGTAVPTRIWVLGDSGTGRGGALAVRDAYHRFAASTRTATSLWLMLGDNAYETGTDAEYQRGVFDTYPEMLRSAVLWPALGNHDTAESTIPDLDYPYFRIFTLPARGEAGGVPSGTESYYSFDYGNIHFIALDSMTSSRSSQGAMAAWLRDDLAATRQPWILAYWHHPPYSKGSHDSDRERELVEMRQNLVPILEEGGVDLVLAGHSHGYERSYLIDGHYGHSSTFVTAMKRNGGNGRLHGDGAYFKPGIESREGTVYVVAGSGARIGGGSLDHPAMAVSLNRLGSLVLDIDGTTLHATFLREDGTIDDVFTISQRKPGKRRAVTAGHD